MSSDKGGSMSIKHATQIARALQVKNEELRGTMQLAIQKIQALGAELAGLTRVLWIVINHEGGTVEVTEAAQAAAPATAKLRVHHNPDNGDVTLEAYDEAVASDQLALCDEGSTTTTEEEVVSNAHVEGAEG